MKEKKNMPENKTEEIMNPPVFDEDGEKELISMDDLLEQLKHPSNSFFCSIADDGTRKSKIRIYNAVNSADGKLSDHIGEVLEVEDVVAHPVMLVDEETGELIPCLRTVLVTTDGKTYAAVSQGITNSLNKIFGIVGMPSWKVDPVKMKIRQVKTRNGNNKVNTIELVE